MEGLQLQSDLGRGQAPTNDWKTYTSKQNQEKHMENREISTFCPFHDNSNAINKCKPDAIIPFCASLKFKFKC